MAELNQNTTRQDRERALKQLNPNISQGEIENIFKTFGGSNNPADGTQNQGETLKETVETDASPDLESNEPPMIDADDIPNQVEAQEPQPEPDTTKQQALDIAREEDPEVAQAEAREDALLQELLTTVRSLEGEAAFEADTREQLGIPELEQDINQIKQTIRNKRSSLRAGLVDVEGKPIAMEFITGQQAQMKRQAAIEIDTLSSAAQAAQGNLALAEQKLDRAISLKFDPIKQRLKTLKTALNINRDLLNREQKKAAKEKEIEISLLERDLDIQQEENKLAQKAAIAATKRARELAEGSLQEGAPPQLVADVLKSVQAGELGVSGVVDRLGEFLSDDEKEEMERLDIQLKTQKINNQIITRKLKQKELDEMQASVGSGAKKPPKKPKKSEREELNFYNRMRSAEATMRKIEKEIIAEAKAKGKDSINEIMGGPNNLLSAKKQQYKQAMREFTEARLRAESGAAIPPSEFRGDRKTYGMRFGDKISVLEQKKESRERVANNFAITSGNAFWEFYGINPVEAIENEGTTLNIEAPGQEALDTSRNIESLSDENIETGTVIEI